MADTFRLVTVRAGGQVSVVRDLETGSTFFKVRDSFQIVPPASRPNLSQRFQRYGGARVVSESHDNGVIQWQALVAGATADAALANATTMAAELRQAVEQRYIEHKPDGATQTTLFEIRGPATLTPRYRWVQFAGAMSMVVEVQVPVAPLALGLPMDIRDDFSVDSIADYTFDAGGGTLSVSGGQLVPSTTATKRLYHSARGYDHSDVQVTKKYTVGTAFTSSSPGAGARRLDANNGLYAALYNGGANLGVWKLDGGTDTVLANTGVSVPGSGSTNWIRLRCEGNVITAEHWTSQPTPMGTPTNTISHQLTGADATKFGVGVGGDAWMRLALGDTNWRYDDFTVEPYTYRNLTLPEAIRLNGSVPGDAPALCDVTITPSGGSAAPIFALLGWTQRAQSHNLVWNGDWEEDTQGWRITGMEVNNAPSSLTRVTAQKKFGIASGEVVTPATTASGPEFPVRHRFKKGVTYSARGWFRSTSQTTQVQLVLWGPVGPDSGVSTAVALSPTWTEHTLTWTPTADHNYAVLSPRTNAATATTFQIDGLQVYEGTTAPTLGLHSEGAGGPAPFGILEAEGADTGDISASWAITSDAGSRGGFRLYDATNSGAETYTAGWYIDPSTLTPDDFTLGEVDLEVWGRFKLNGSNVSPKAILSARPEAGTNFGAERFTAEHGSLGKLMIAFTGEPFHRLGTITLPCDTSRPARWKLYLTCTTAAGSSGDFGLDYLITLPIRSRAASPTARANDATYPKFVASTSETSRLITSDLRGFTAKPPGAFTGDKGLGGSLIEFPPGSVDILVKLSSAVPDTSGADQEEHAATVHAAVWPRWHLWRAG